MDQTLSLMLVGSRLGGRSILSKEKPLLELANFMVNGYSCFSEYIRYLASGIPWQITSFTDLRKIEQFRYAFRDEKAKHIEKRVPIKKYLRAARLREKMII